ncbi:MAG: hypothetical protein V1859_08510 [archaeon]
MTKTKNIVNSQLLIKVIALLFLFYIVAGCNRATTPSPAGDKISSGPIVNSISPSVMVSGEEITFSVEGDWFQEEDGYKKGYARLYPVERVETGKEDPGAPSAKDDINLKYKFVSKNRVEVTLTTPKYVKGKIIKYDPNKYVLAIYNEIGSTIKKSDAPIPGQEWARQLVVEYGNSLSVIPPRPKISELYFSKADSQGNPVDSKGKKLEDTYGVNAFNNGGSLFVPVENKNAISINKPDISLSFNNVILTLGGENFLNINKIYIENENSHDIFPLKFATTFNKKRYSDRTLFEKPNYIVDNYIQGKLEENEYYLYGLYIPEFTPIGSYNLVISTASGLTEKSEKTKFGLAKTLCTKKIENIPKIKSATQIDKNVQIIATNIGIKKELLTGVYFFDGMTYGAFDPKNIVLKESQVKGEYIIEGLAFPSTLKGKQYLFVVYDNCMSGVDLENTYTNIGITDKNDNKADEASKQSNKVSATSSEIEKLT